MKILCSCSCPPRSDHDVPINLQPDKCYSLFCNFLSLYEWTLEGQSPENSLSCIFQVIGNILSQRYRASMTKNSQQNTKIRANGRDPIGSQDCSSLLQYLHRNK